MSKGCEGARLREKKMPFPKEKLFFIEIGNFDAPQSLCIPADSAADSPNSTRNESVKPNAMPIIR